MKTYILSYPEVKFLAKFTTGQVLKYYIVHYKTPPGLPLSGEEIFDPPDKGDLGGWVNMIFLPRMTAQNSQKSQARTF